MNILVTGGAGYIGSHTCVELIEAGYDVIIVDNLYNSKMEAVKRIEKLAGKKVKFYKTDILDEQGMDDVFAQNKIDAVIHFAGYKAVGESVEKPLLYFQNNISGSIVLFNTMKKYNVKKIVFSSSATVYDMNNKLPLKEEMKMNSNCPYGRTKVIIEQMLNDIYYSDNQWRISILRYFNPAGAHKSGDIGEDPNGIPNNLLPYISQVAVGKLQKLNVFGDDYDTIDGTGVRDYIHVVDLAKGHLKALEYISKNEGLEIFNLGTGQGTSVLEIITAFEKNTNKKIPYDIVDRRPGDIASCYADVSKANKMLNWKAEKTIDDICSSSWKWQTQNPNGY